MEIRHSLYQSEASRIIIFVIIFVVRLGHLDEEKKIDLSHVSSIETHTGEKTTLNESNQIVDETNKDPFRTEPVVLISANDGPNNKVIHGSG